MNFAQDPRLIAPPFISPTYKQQTSQFIFNLQLVSHHPHSIHFYIASSFGCCLFEATHIRSLNPNSTVTLSFILTPTNLIGNNIDTVVIYASPHHIFEQFPLNSGSLTVTKLIFNEDNKVDPTVLEILQNEVDYRLQEAEQLKTKGELPKALIKYQEAYGIMRRSQKGIISMIECRFLMKDFAGAVRDIETILLQKPDDPHAIICKLMVLMEWQSKTINKNDQLYSYIKSSLECINTNRYYLNLKDQTMFSALIENFKTYKKVPQRQSNKTLKNLYQTALAKYSEDLPIAKFYHSKEVFQQQIRELLTMSDPQANATPQYVIDPINYQIMKRPYILPSGNTFEQQSLKEYFSTNGYKDPITRQPINFNFIFPNINLEIYIRQHPHLKEWQKYQYDFIHN